MRQHPRCIGPIDTGLKRILITTVLLAFWLHATKSGRAEAPADKGAIPPQTPIVFDLDVVPVLTKSGCNAASCHGAAAGRGGFRLSLFGGDPSFDFDSITRQLRGRRVNFANPMQSLLLRKPLGEMDHEGGVRFAADSPEAEILARWIEDGASRDSGPELRTLLVEPKAIVSNQLPSEAQLKVQAIFSDGSERDVTDWAVYQSDDVTTTDVTMSGHVAMKRRGRSHLVVSYLSELAVVPVSVPYDSQRVGSENAANRNEESGTWIDHPIDATLRELGIESSSQARPETLARRVSLALVGKLPTPEQLTEFLEQDPDTRYSQYVDSLMASDDFNSYWTYHLSRLLRVRAPVKEPQVPAALHDWLLEQVAKDASWNEMARAMIAANGDTHVYGPAVLHRLSGDARSEAEFVSEVFMGTRLRCANCHNHPLDIWTQDDYHGLAAVFARVRRGRTISTLPSGEVSHPGTGEAAIPRIPGSRYLDIEDDPREQLANWFADDPEQMLARAFVNRIWKRMMGRGLVEPVDDLRASNPATHPDLLLAMTEYFAENEYRLRPLLRAIVMSNAFQRRGPNESNQFDSRFNSHFLETPLDPAVLLDATGLVTGVSEPFASEPSVASAVALANPSAPSPALDLLGRCPVDEDCDDGSAGASLALPRVLHLINGDLLNERIAAPNGRLHQLIRSETTPFEIIEQIYFLAYSRHLNEREQAFWAEQVDGLDLEAAIPVLEDFLWGVLNSREFRTNH